MISLKFEAGTPAELYAQVRSYVEGEGGLGTSGARSPVDVPPGPTNDDYRRAINAIPAGKVAAYSVVSEVVRGDAHGSQKVAGLAANDTRLRTAHRVVKIDRSIAAGFRWPDGRMGGADEARELLETEGVGFDIHGKVRPEFMLSPHELREHYEAEQN
jgi:alkylated DNA nucleotide flippase Atl1